MSHTRSYMCSFNCAQNTAVTHGFCCGGARFTNSSGHDDCTKTGDRISGLSEAASASDICY